MKWHHQFFEGAFLFLLVLLAITVWVYAVATFVSWEFITIPWVYVRAWLIVVIILTIFCAVKYANFHADN
jgi:hypothetical protein